MISLNELHKKALPEQKKKAVKIDVVSYYLWRPICDLLSIFLIGKVSATTVTIFSFYMCIASFIAFSSKQGVGGALLGFFLLWMWNIADGIDGNIARYTATCSKAGDLWDAVAGYTAMIVFYLGSGLVASYEDSILVVTFIKSEDYVLIGAVSALCMIFPRLIIQKKQVVYGSALVKEFKDKVNYGIMKKFALNITSINGLAGVLLLISIITRTVNIFVIVYGIIMLGFGVVSLIMVMKSLE